MVYIKIENKTPIIANCHSNDLDENFRLIIDPKTREITEKPENPSISVSIAYSRICNFLKNNEPIPDETCAEWG